MMFKTTATILVLCVTFAGAAEQGVELFNGKDLSGWTMAGPGKFEIKNGELHTIDGMGLLWYHKELTDFTLSLEFKVSRKEDNSGVFIRFADPGGDPWKAVLDGEEIQIHDAGTKMQTGGIYNAKAATELASKPPGEWNKMEIIVVGPKVTVKLNDKVVNEHESRKFQPKGYVGLQNHDPDSKVTFRNIRLIEGPPKPPARELPKPQAIDPKRAPGLLGRYFKDTVGFEAVAKAGEPFYVRIDEKIEFRRRSGQFHRTKLSNNFAARWDGYLRVTTPQELDLAIFSDDGARVYIADQLVLDNDRPDPQKPREAFVKLEAGDYPLRVEYYNGPGAGGIFFGKKGADDQYAPLDEKMFVHDRAQQDVKWNADAWKKTRWSQREWAAKHGERWDKMDYGPFISHTIEIDQNNHALKGIALKLGDREQATVVFDTSQCRFAGGWTDGFLNLTGIAFDGSFDTNPTPDGEILFQTPAAKIAGKYKGLHVHGNRVVLHYTLDGVDVLDAPWAQSIGDQVVITRTIKLSPSDQPLAMLIDRMNEDCGMVVMTPDEVTIELRGEDRYLLFPPREAPTTYRITLSRSGAVMPAELQTLVAAPEDIDALMRAGERRWKDDVVTKGEVGAATQPYVVDTLTVPETNPYNAWMRLCGLDFFSDGRAAVSTFSGDVWIVSGIDEKLEKLTWRRFATGLFQPMGLKIVDDIVYVLGRDQITRLKDSNGDGEADAYENFNNDCEITRNFLEFARDLQTDGEGNFYFVKSKPMQRGGRGSDHATAHGGTVLRVMQDGGKLEVIAHGLTDPTGLALRAGKVLVADNRPGRLTFADSDSPICWLAPEADTFPGAPIAIAGDQWGPFNGRLLHTSYGKSVLFLVLSEQVDDQVQGGIVKFPELRFHSGICRPRFNPKDGQLYIAGLRLWQTSAARDGTLQRVRYTGAAVHMPADLRVNHDGVAITFTSELDPSITKDIANYAIEQWNYVRSSDGSGTEHSVADPKEKGHDAVKVQSAELSADGKTVTLKLEKIAPVMQMKIAAKLKGKDGAPIDCVIYNTIHKLPKAPATAPATTTAAK